MKVKVKRKERLFIIRDISKNICEVAPLSELIKWFEKRREKRVLTLTRRHIVTTMNVVEDLERAVKAFLKGEKEIMKECIERVKIEEGEADNIRREVMRELARGELPPHDREDLMHLIKRVDMVADWSLESARILRVIPVTEVPEKLRRACVEMIEGVKKCALALEKSIDSIASEREEALKAADEVEEMEHIVDELYEKARAVLIGEEKLKVGVAILVSQLLNSIEMIADWCEDACDQIRVIVVRH